MRLIYNGDDVYDENHEIQSIKNTIGTGTLDTDEKTIIPAINELKSNLTDLQVYSTTEKVIGTWIDGKPIYRKSYSGACVKSNTVVLEYTSNIDKIISAYGSATSDYNRRWNIPNTVSGDGGYDNRYALTTTTSQLYLQFLANYRTSDNFVFTIEYTKTTD